MEDVNVDLSPDHIECPVCGEYVLQDEYSFTDGMCWECRETEDEEEGEA